MTQSSKKAVLPNNLGAAWFVCQCFGIGTRELAAARDRLRKTEVNQGVDFPANISREMIKRQKTRTTELSGMLVTFCREALYHRIRRQEKGEDEIPDFAFTTGMTETLVFSLLHLYEKVLPGLNAEDVPPEEALWALVEDLFLPTVYLQLTQKWRDGLEYEFKGTETWYLPSVSDGKRLDPIPRVLNYWLRAAGFHSGYSVYKSTALDSWKRKVDRWRAGKDVPTARNLHGLLKRFAKESSWAGDFEGWKARFTLACAMQNFCKRLDDFMRSVKPDASLELVKIIHKMETERIVLDDDRLLAEANTFFAARLWQYRLQREGKWKYQVTARVRKEWKKSFSKRVTDERIARVRAKMEWQSNPGNWFLEALKKRFRPNSAAKFGSLQGCILELGVDELNQRLASKRAGGRNTRQR